MFAIVARSGSDMADTPGPWNSTNLSTTPFLRSICVTVSVRSVAVTPSRNWPYSLNPPPSGAPMDSGGAGEAALRQKLQIDLMHNAGGRGDDVQIVEGLRTPAQELVAFTVAIELH